MCWQRCSTCRIGLLPECTLRLVRILHYIGAVEVIRSLNDHNTIPTSKRTPRRLVLATFCGLAALLTSSLAQADPRRGDGVHDRIEFRRGFHELTVRLSRTHRWQRFASRDLMVRFVLHHAKPAIHSTHTARIDDSTLNDSNRSIVVNSGLERTRLVIVGEMPAATGTWRANYLCRQRPPRGPPSLLAS